SRYFFFTSRRRHTRWPRDWSSDVCSSGLVTPLVARRRWLWPAVASAIALLLGATASWYLVAHRKGTESSSFRARRSVAVLGFKNASGKPDEAWISTALSEMLATELAAGERLRTIPGENVARTKHDPSLPDPDPY